MGGDLPVLAKLSHSLVKKRDSTRKRLCALQKSWLAMSACHAGRLADNRTPVGSGRFRDLPKTREESWEGL